MRLLGLHVQNLIHTVHIYKSLIYTTPLQVTLDVYSNVLLDLSLKTQKTWLNLLGMPFHTQYDIREQAERKTIPASGRICWVMNATMT